MIFEIMLEHFLLMESLWMCTSHFDQNVIAYYSFYFGCLFLKKILWTLCVLILEQLCFLFFYVFTSSLFLLCCFLLSKDIYSLYLSLTFRFSTLLPFSLKKKCVFLSLVCIFFVSNIFFGSALSLPNFFSPNYSSLTILPPKSMRGRVVRGTERDTEVPKNEKFEEC